MPRRTRRSDRPKRELITDELLRRIEQEVYRPNTFLPSERVLAEEFRVSRPTLRNALAPLVKSGRLVNQPGVGTRVNGDRPSAPGRSGSEREWKTLALMLPDIGNRVFLEFTEAIEYTALQSSYHLLLCNFRHQPALEERQIRQLVSRKVDGMILAHDPNLPFPESLSTVVEAKIPAVFLFSAPTAIRVDAVLLDEQAGVNQVMRYLFSLGHRRIAFCRPVSGATHPREKFFLEYMQRIGVSVPEHFLIPFESTDNLHCRKTLQRVLRQRPAPTAIFAGNDRVALIVLSQLLALGVDVPGAMSVVGFDNQRFTEHLPVPLTTVDQPKQEMGRRAVELLLEQIEMGPPVGPRREIFQPHLVIRDSCSVAPAARQAFEEPVVRHAP